MCVSMCQDFMKHIWTLLKLGADLPAGFESRQLTWIIIQSRRVRPCLNLDYFPQRRLSSPPEPQISTDPIMSAEAHFGKKASE